MSNLLYLPDNEYQKEFDSEIKKASTITDNGGSDGYIVLEETLFHKEGGGQPADHGKIFWNGSKTKVIDVQKEHGEVRHYLKGMIPESGTDVHGEIDWERRHKHMRMHTAQHALSLVVLNMYDASTAGNQIHEDYSRIDFEPVEFEEDDVEKIENAVNALIEKELEVEKKMMSRDLLEQEVEAGRTNLDLIPDGVDPLRAVIIGEEDICPCGGTHVENVIEIGKINITNRISKGSNVERLEFRLKS